MRKVHGKDVKFKVALEAIRGDLTIAQIVAKYGIAESLVFKWKKQLLDEGSQVFEGRQKDTVDHKIKDLHAKIGQLTLERDFLEEALFKGR